MSLAEIKDAVAQNLTEDGILPKIQAELRAAVFHSLNKRGFTKQNHPHRQPPAVNPRLSEYLQTQNGRLTFSLVREFLEHFELEFTTSVLVPESGQTSAAFMGREALSQQLPTVNASPNEPLLASLVPSDGRPSTASNVVSEPVAAMGTLRPGTSSNIPSNQGRPGTSSTAPSNLSPLVTPEGKGGTFRRVTHVTSAPPLTETTPKRASPEVAFVNDGDATPVGSEVDVSEEYPDDFDSVGDDDGEDDPLPFTVQRRDFAHDEENTEDLSINSGQTDFDYDLVENVS